MSEEESNLQAARDAVNAAVPPIGGILLFAGENLPKGWHYCDGAVLRREKYPRLFEAIGTKFGEGDGSTTFPIPHLADLAVNIRYIIRTDPVESDKPQAGSRILGLVMGVPGRR